MKLTSRDVVLAALIAALYASLVIVLPFISFFIWQVRIADSLIPLSTVYGIPAVLGVTIGCFIGNIIGAPWGSLALGLIDAIFGSIANFIASYIAYKLAYKTESKMRILIACTSSTLIITLIVGSYLPLLMKAIGLEVPIWLGWLGVLPGSIISIIIIGFNLVIFIKRVQKHILSANPQGT